MKSSLLRALGLPLILTLAAACGGGEDAPTMDIVGSIPWGQTESLDYVLKERGREVATGTLSLTVEGSQTRLLQRYTSGANSDEITVVVDSKTLKPLSSTRVIQGPEDRETLTVSYTEQGALIRQGERQSGLSVPEHAYDNDSSLFLWRTIDFREGYEARYVTIITNRRSRQTVELRVRGKEQVTVPAGTFTAWRLEIKGANAEQVAWYADTPTRPLVKYDNDRGTVFELQTRP
ncbi:MAG TPA: DUF3108 domain-containing protein [Dehalococcoidia bacterium]|nr:DUF3108 domain-containing protein [Dehalococcoidia bacterium]